MSTNSILLKLSATADILGGEVFFTDEHGRDTQYNNEGLIPESMYIRLIGSDDSIAYISAKEIDDLLSNIYDSTVNTANLALTNVLELKNTAVNKSEIDALQELLDDKASNIDLQLVQSDIELKADKSDITAISNSLYNKADKTDIDALIELINSKGNNSVVEQLKNDIETKADQSYVKSLVDEINTRVTRAEVRLILDDINTLKTTVQAITDENTIASINSRIDDLYNKLQNKLALDSVSSINNSISNINENIDNINRKLYETENLLQTKVSNKTLYTNIANINALLSNISDQVNLKADKSDVIVKANKSDLDSLTKRFIALNQEVNDNKINDNNNYNGLYNKINTKADKEQTDTKINNLISELENKVDYSNYNAAKNSIINRLESVESTVDNTCSSLKEDVYKLECELDNTTTTLQSADNVLDNKIKQCNTLINNIRSANDINTEKLKQPWVRVLSTNEYKRLRDYDPTLISYNKYYKYPNIIYFVVDFNKPKAIYIGNIQIAKAIQTGSIGFDYVFPFTF